MRIRRLPHVVVALAATVAPLAALAQGTDGSVTTAPFARAPVMGIPVLILLAFVLAGAAAYVLRRGAGKTVVVGFMVLLTALAGLGYAAVSSTLPVQGSQCAMQTTQMFDTSAPPILISQCQDPIHIVSIEVPCEMQVGPSMCSVGQVLANGEDCFLPGCF